MRIVTTLSLLALASLACGKSAEQTRSTAPADAGVYLPPASMPAAASAVALADAGTKSLGCRVLTQIGGKPRSHIALDEEVTLEASERMTIKDPVSSREMRIAGPARVKPCMSDVVELYEGTVELLPGAPLADLVVLSPDSATVSAHPVSIEVTAAGTRSPVIADQPKQNLVPRSARTFEQLLKECETTSAKSAELTSALKTGTISQSAIEAQIEAKRKARAACGIARVRAHEMKGLSAPSLAKLAAADLRWH